MKENAKVLRLVEGALLLALATVLSLVKLVDLPYGGSITACSALPVLLIGYRHGTVYGLFAGTVYALIQLLVGMNTLSYFTTPLSIVAVILLDYLLAFTVLGLGGLFRRRMDQTPALMLAALLTGILRYTCHVIAGCTVWAGLSIPDSAALVYSLAYNATYMVPEVLVTVLGAWYVSRTLDLRGARPARRTVAGNAGGRWSLVAASVAVVALVADVVLLAPHLQDAETGDFIITGLAAANWPVVGAVTGAGALLCGLFAWLSRRK
ncbi:MAG: hypothetical protein E7541_03765 [Ruminococcaceae bacterium]|nr:hypothetical protein [Oscillospiraceae bacterium]